MYQGKTLQLLPLGQADEGLVEMRFDRDGESINKLDRRTTDEWAEVTRLLAATPTLRGVLVTSSKPVFIVGADITEFGTTFKLEHDALVANTLRANDIGNAFEDLPVPTVVAINGYALGGGLEVAMTASARVMSTAALIGVPEVKLGLYPGLAGTVRLSRVAGPAAAVDWVTTGRNIKAEQALEAGVVDAIAQPEHLQETALALLRKAVAGEFDWQAAQARKRVPVALPAAELKTLFQTLREKVQKTAPKHQPAAMMALDMMEKAAPLDRAGAIRAEAEDFARVAKTQAAASLVQAFLNDQALKKLFRQHAKQARPVKKGAVLGAGIMGGGIAYTSALRGVPVRMKDIAQAQLELGSGEAKKQLAKLVKNGRQSQEKADAILATIHPQLSYEGFTDADVVIEAVVEKLEVKHVVLAELEKMVRDDTVIASNTSSLRIDDIAKPLARPENFVGMHFFNPVPVMPLVEVIRGAKTSDQAVATAVGYGVAMGKTPIVVKDCPGFLVNRILTPYIRGFLQLVEDGVDFVKIDKTMEAFGWPMGPAYLEDVVGMDTGSHVSDTISAGYADRFPHLQNDAMRLMVANKRYGQKNGIGFYKYELDPSGKPRKLAAEDSHELLKQVQPKGQREAEPQEIIDRMMVPMLLEAARALEEGVVGTAAELDMALQMGVGFPAYLGGALKYADWLGLDKVVALADQYRHLGTMYEATPAMRTMAAEGKTYYSA